MIPRKAFSAILLVMILSLPACQPARLPEESLQVTPSPTGNLSVQVNRLATQTASAGQLEARIPEATQTSAVLAPSRRSTEPSAFRTAPPQPSPTLESAGLFRQVSNAEALSVGLVLRLQAAADGSLTLLSEGGYSRYQGGVWTGYFTDFMGTLVGMDRLDQPWVASRDGNQISAWDGQSWQVYTSTLGWQPIESQLSMPVKSGLLEGHGGDLWLATSTDVRRFDGARWQVYSSREMGMPDPQAGELLPTFLLALLESENQIWVGRCDWGGPGPFGGGGVRLFDGQAWRSVGQALDSGCASALATDNDEQVWVGLDASLWRVDLASSALESISLPEPPAQGRFGYFTELLLAPDGSLWGELQLCGGASCGVAELLYHWQNGDWRQIGEASEPLSRRLILDASGNAWLFIQDQVFRIVDDEPILEAKLQILAATRDSSGGLWLIARAGGPPTLWRLEKP